MWMAMTSGSVARRLCGSGVGGEVPSPSSVWPADGEEPSADPRSASLPRSLSRPVHEASSDSSSASAQTIVRRLFDPREEAGSRRATSLTLGGGHNPALARGSLSGAMVRGENSACAGYSPLR